MTDFYVKNELNLDPKDFHAEIGPALKELNNRTHLKPDTVITDPVELENLVNETIGALLEIFDVTEEVRGEIVSRVGDHLYDEAIGAFIKETIDSLELIAGRYEHRSRYDPLRDHRQRRRNASLRIGFGRGGDQG